MIYSGVTGSELNILYREYDRYRKAGKETLTVRPAFSQNVIYGFEKDMRIRFKGLLLNVVEANNQSLHTELVEFDPSIF